MRRLEVGYQEWIGGLITRQDNKDKNEQSEGW